MPESAEREEYMRTAAEAEEAEKKFQQANERYRSGQGDMLAGGEEHDAWWKKQFAAWKLRRLEGRTAKEAYRLNEQYDEKFGRAYRAVESVIDFERKHGIETGQPESISGRTKKEHEQLVDSAREIALELITFEESELGAKKREFREMYGELFETVRENAVTA